MRGSVVKRCPCPVEHDTKGRRKTCRKPHGSWSYVANLPPDPTTGRRRQKRASGFTTREEAEKALGDYLTDSGNGQGSYDERQTVETYLRSWLDLKRDTGTRATTLASYRQHAEHYLIPHLGRWRLQDLRATHIEAMMREIRKPRPAVPDGERAAKGQRRNPGALSPATLQRVHATLRSALAAAVRKNLLRDNPATKVDLARPARPKVHPWEPGELGRFLDHAHADRLGPLFDTAALTGLRRGELCGLRWEDVDLVRGRVTVRRQLVELRGGGVCPYCGQLHKQFVFGAPKTDAGEGRAVDLDTRTVGVLLTHRLEQEAEREAWGEAYADHGLVFAREDGNPVSPDHVTNRFAALTEAAGLRRVRFHDLRHGQASLMLAAGVPLAVVSKRLGHSSVQITSDTYSHLLEGVGQAAANAAAALVPRSGPGALAPGAA